MSAELRDGRAAQGRPEAVAGDSVACGVRAAVGAGRSAPSSGTAVSPLPMAPEAAGPLMRLLRWVFAIRAWAGALCALLRTALADRPGAGERRRRAAAAYSGRPLVPVRFDGGSR